MKKNCVICLDSITHPLCSECYLLQVDTWLEQVGLRRETRERIMNNIKKNIPIDGNNDEECISCGKNLDVCSYCFFHKAAKVLKRMNFPEEFLQYFHATFNYYPYKDL